MSRMNLLSLTITLFLLFASTQVMAGGNNLNIPETDTGDFQLVGFFDLRERNIYPVNKH